MSLLQKLKTLFGFTTTATTATVEPNAGTAKRDTSPPVIPAPVQSGPPPAGFQRDRIIRFIVSKLRAYQNEPETAPIGLQLSISCASSEEEEIYRVAIWANQPGKFRDELSRQLADNYINLPQNWEFDYHFISDKVPPAGSFQDGNLSLAVLDALKQDNSPILAKTTTLLGHTEQDEYLLDPTHKTMFYIGRGHRSQAASGRVRTNDIVVLNEDDPAYSPTKGTENAAVSRAHATIRYDPTQKRYTLLVDPGGLPANGNKTKIIHPDDSVERADIPGMGYPLLGGDQIELGGGVVLLFEVLGG